MAVRCVVYTCNEYADTLPAVAYLLSVFWSREQPVAYAGCPRRDDLPESWAWYDVQSRIAARWSDGLIEFLKLLDDDVICWLLDDYCICRTVDNAAIDSLADYMRGRQDVLKIDLTADRLHSGAAVDVDCWGHVDLIETAWDTPYQFSTQAALWNRELLLSLLRPEMSPWDFELRADHHPALRVLGTRQWPLRYVNFLGMGLAKDEYRTRHRRQGLGGVTVEWIPEEHVQAMIDGGLMPAGKRLNNEVNR